MLLRSRTVRGLECCGAPGPELGAWMLDEVDEAAVLAAALAAAVVVVVEEGCCRRMRASV